MRYSLAPEKSSAYQTGAAMLFLAVGIILGALGLQYLGGYEPCELCLQQRWAYYAGIPVLFAALAVLSADHPRAASVLFLLVALAFLANAGLGVYQAGAEWKFWPGPTACSGDFNPSAEGGASFLARLAHSKVVRCDEPALRIFGLSLAGWNAIVSFLVFIGCTRAAFSVRDSLDD